MALGALDCVLLTFEVQLAVARGFRVSHSQQCDRVSLREYKKGRDNPWAAKTLKSSQHAFRENPSPGPQTTVQVSASSALIPSEVLGAEPLCSGVSVMLQGFVLPELEHEGSSSRITDLGGSVFGTLKPRL